jgi:hypothetical protein
MALGLFGSFSFERLCFVSCAGCLMRQKKRLQMKLNTIFSSLLTPLLLSTSAFCWTGPAFVAELTVQNQNLNDQAEANIVMTNLVSFCRLPFSDRLIVMTEVNDLNAPTVASVLRVLQTRFDAVNSRPEALMSPAVVRHDDDVITPTNLPNSPVSGQGTSIEGQQTNTQSNQDGSQNGSFHSNQDQSTAQQTVTLPSLTNGTSTGCGCGSMCIIL